LVEATLQHTASDRAVKSAAGRRDPIAGRLLDLVLASLLLILCLPVMLLVALVIWIEDGGPILFAQTRVGRNGKLFSCFKFRSMCVEADARLMSILGKDASAEIEWRLNQKLRADPRVTASGAFIRRRSLDELPQFVNVIRGDMSLVGPRPIVPAETVRYGRRIRQYCSVRPGLTGLWQISGRSEAGYRSRIAMDVVYARSKRISLDLRIIAATIPVVLMGKGSY
jgi:exopolysaccharide production protein ExoY